MFHETTPEGNMFNMVADIVLFVFPWFPDELQCCVGCLIWCRRLFGSLRFKAALICTRSARCSSFNMFRVEAALVHRLTSNSRDCFVKGTNSCLLLLTLFIALSLSLSIACCFSYTSINQTTRR